MNITVDDMLKMKASSFYLTIALLGQPTSEEEMKLIKEKPVDKKTGIDEMKRIFGDSYIVEDDEEDYSSFIKKQ